MTRELTTLRWRYSELSELYRLLLEELAAGRSTLQFVRRAKTLKLNLAIPEARDAAMLKELHLVHPHLLQARDALAARASDRTCAAAHDFLRECSGYFTGGANAYKPMPDDGGIKSIREMLERDGCGTLVTRDLLTALAAHYLDRFTPAAVAANAKKVLLESPSKYPECTRRSQFAERFDGGSSDGRGVQYAGGGHRAAGADEPVWPALEHLESPDLEVNVASGLPMIAGTPYDAGGNVYGTSSTFD